MASDFKRLLAAAADAALSDDQPTEALHRPGANKGHGGAFRGLRGVAAGAVLVAAARAATKRGPGPMSLVRHLPKPDLPDLSELTERARDLIDDWFPDEEPDEDFDAEDEDEDYEEPEADADDEDEELEDDEEPEDEEELEDEDEDYDVEPSERIDPPARPPRPPKRKKAKTG